MDSLDNWQLYCIAAALLLCASTLILRAARSLLKDIRGPECPSFWLGNESDIRYQAEVGDVEFSWLRKFGGAWKVYGPLGDERLMLADPKALQYVLQTSSYRFPKRADARAHQRMRVGDGIVWAHGQQHHRQRKIMNPAFTVPQLKSFVPLFLTYSHKLVQRWKEEEITPSKDQQPLSNVHKWLSRATLDIIGDSGFGFQFDALDNAKSELGSAYHNLYTSTLYPSRWDVVFRYLWNYASPSLLWWLRYLPVPEYIRFRRYQDFISDYGRKLMAQAKARNVKGTGRDIISVLLRANDAEEAKLKLTEKEVVDQISVLVLAGHETTASSLTWWFWELARHKDWQDRVREEIRSVRRKVSGRGDDNFSLGDLEGMSVMQATLKEAMRLDPIVWMLSRTAENDDVIPLANPIISKSGQQLSSIPVRKGQNIEISIAAYNRNPDVWGEDADTWNPGRFISQKSGMTSVGLYASLLNFSAGIRGCLGWRFSVLEMQAIAATVIENFEFTLPTQNEENRIWRRPAIIMAPMAAGRSGMWMGLKVKPCDQS